MSRPDTASAAEPRIPRAERTVHRRSASVPMRVVAQRLSPEEADRLARSGPAPAPARAPGPAARPAVPATGAATALEQAPPPSAEIVGPRPAADRPLPVLDRRIRRRPFTRLLALVRGRRREGSCGRHRPDTIPSQGWSMFAPQRRSRRRFGVRR